MSQRFMREYKRLSKESRMIEKRSRSRAIAIAKAKDRAKRRARMQSMSKTQSQSKSQSQTRSKTKTSTDRKTRTHKFGWKSGDGTSSREILVHRNARNRSHCVSLVRVNHPKANGATLQSKGRGRCYAEFNMKLAGELKKRGVKVLFYIAPQIWAWRQGRVKKLKASIEDLLCIFPHRRPID